MKNSLLLFLLAFVFTAPSSLAEDDANQVLVFLKNGDVKLYFDDQLDRIEPSYYDTDSIKYDHLVSQVFHTKDGKATIVPISDIDSVAFGNHNVVDIKSDVHVLKQIDIDNIVDYDGAENIIYYKASTPSSIFPYSGEKLFYGDFTPLFPVGLCARVTGIVKEGEISKVYVEDIELTEVFNELFFAGKSDLFKSLPISPQRVKMNETEAKAFNVLSATGNIEAANVVCEPLKGYYHIDFEGEISFGLNIEIETDDTEEINKEYPIISNIAPPVIRALDAVGLISCGLNLVAFMDLEAHLKVNFSLQRRYPIKISWTRKRNSNTCDNVESEDDSANPTIDEAKAEIMLDGKAYFGLGLTLNISTLKDHLGTDLKLKYGPEFSGELGFGVMRELAEKYSAQNYLKGTLGVCQKIAFEIETYNHFFFGRRNKIFTIERKFGSHELHLFPEFKDTRAVASTKKETVETNSDISVATVSEEKIAAPVLPGFQLFDLNENVVDSVFFDEPIKPFDDEPKGLKHTFKKVKDTEQLYLQPVFKYFDHTLKAKPVAVKKDVMLQPVIFNLGNGAVNLISGNPVVGFAANNETAVLIGNYLPLEKPNPAFADGYFAGTGKFMGDKESEDLLGTWYGNLKDGSAIELIFNKDNSGSGSDRSGSYNFTYTLNDPQSGDVSLNIDEKNSYVLKVYDISQTSLNVFISHLGESCQLTKQ